MAGLTGKSRFAWRLAVVAMWAAAVACTRVPLATRPVPTALLLAGWGELRGPPARTFAEATAAASLDDLAAFWREDFGTWSLTPAAWRPVGRLPDAARGRWSPAAAALAVRGEGLGWPAGPAEVLAAAVRLRGHPPWDVPATRLTLWAVLRGRTVVAGWLTFAAFGRTWVTVADEGPTVLTLPYWTQPPLAGLSRDQRSALPAGAPLVAVARAPGAPGGAVAITFGEGLSAFEALLVRQGAEWRCLPLGPVGSVLGGTPAVRWEDAPGGGRELAVRFAPGGSGQGLAVFRVSRAGGAWRVSPLFAGDGDVVLELAAGRAGRVLVLGLRRGAGTGRRTWRAYQSVVWRDGAFRLGPGLVVADPGVSIGPGAAAPGGRSAVPGLVGLDVEAAVARLAAGGLEAVVVPLQDPHHAAGTVTGQHPAQGTQLPVASMVRVEVAAGAGTLPAPPPPLAALRLEAPGGTRFARPAALRRWWQELAWAASGRPPVIPVARGPGGLTPSSQGDLLAARLARVWWVTLPDAGGRGRRRQAVDTLAVSDEPLYAGWLLLGWQGDWVGAARLPAACYEALRRAVADLAGADAGTQP